MTIKSKFSKSKCLNYDISQHYNFKINNCNFLSDNYEISHNFDFLLFLVKNELQI